MQQKWMWNKEENVHTELSHLVSSLWRGINGRRSRIAWCRTTVGTRMERSAERALVGGHRSSQPLIIVQSIAYIHGPNGFDILIGWIIFILSLCRITCSVLGRTLTISPLTRTAPDQTPSNHHPSNRPCQLTGKQTSSNLEETGIAKIDGECITRTLRMNCNDHINEVMWTAVDSSSCAPQSADATHNYTLPNSTRLLHHIIPPSPLIFWIMSIMPLSWIFPFNVMSDGHSWDLL